MNISAISNTSYTNRAQAYDASAIRQKPLDDDIAAVTNAYSDNGKEPAKAADDARRWRHIRNEYYADNSVEEVWEDKDGVQKTVMIVGPHGDAC